MTSRSSANSHKRRASQIKACAMFGDRGFSFTQIAHVLIASPSVHSITRSVRDLLHLRDITFRGIFVWKCMIFIYKEPARDVKGNPTVNY